MYENDVAVSNSHAWRFSGQLYVATIVDKNIGTNDKFYRKVAFLMYTEIFKAKKQLRNQNHTEDWALGCHPRDNGHVTH